MHHAETSLLFVSIGDQSIFISRGGGLVNIYLQGEGDKSIFLPREGG